MDDDLLKSLFIKARDQYENAIRWAFLLVLACIAFHIVTFSQFVSLNQELSTVEAEVAHLKDEDKQLLELGTSLKTFQDNFTVPLETRIDAMVAALVEDFAALNQSIVAVDTRTTREFASPQNETFEPNSPMYVQANFPQTQAKMPLDEDLIALIERADNAEQIRDGLIPFIEENIVDPRFSELNTYWHDELLPDVKNSEESILQLLLENRGMFPERSDIWNRIEANVSNTTAAAEAVTFEPPSADPQWWATIEGKELTLKTIADRASNQLSVQDSSDAVTQILEQVRAALNEQAETEKAIFEKIVDLEDKFEVQEAQLATLGKPFEFFALDLDFVVSTFPLLLGVLLAATLIWESYRLRDLAWSVSLLIENGQGKIAWQWVAAHIGFFPTQFQTLSPVSKLAQLGTASLYLLWIVLVAFQLSRWQNIDLSRVVVFTLGGLLAVGIGLWYRLQTRSQVYTLLKKIEPAAS